MTTTIAPSQGAGVLFTQGGPGANPGYSALDIRRSELPGPVQEGVYAPGDHKVSQRATGANMTVDVNAGPTAFAAVQGDTITGQGLYVVTPHPTPINEAVAASHPTSPRLDLVILEVQDNIHDASGANQARTRVLTGTPTTGTTLDNRTGATALPASALLLADILVPAAAATILDANIRDRRKWARGAFRRIIRTTNDTGGQDYPLNTGGTVTGIGTLLAKRIECSGLPVRMTLSARIIGGSTGNVKLFALLDGLPTDGLPSTDSAINVTTTANAEAAPGQFSWTFTPPAGSHILQWGFTAGGGTGHTIYCRAGIPVLVTVEELVRADTDNN